VPYISVKHSLKIDLSAHSFSEPFTENNFYGNLRGQMVSRRASSGTLNPTHSLFLYRVVKMDFKCLIHNRKQYILQYLLLLWCGNVEFQ